jgi:hypothetical protein
MQYNRLDNPPSTKEDLQSHLSELKLHEVCGPYTIVVQGQRQHERASLEFFQRRRELARQCYTMAQDFHLDPEVVEVSIWIMDKIAMELDTSLLLEEEHAQRQYRAVGMAAFALAAKASGGQQRLHKAHFSRYWRQDFSSLEELEQAELRLLLQIDFAIHPPTASAFARTLLSLLPPIMLQTPVIVPSDQKSTFEQAMELVQLQIRLSLTDPSFDSYSSSRYSPPRRMAQAALQNAIQSLLPQNRYVYIQYFFADALARSPKENFDGKQALDSLQARLSQRLMQHIVAEHETRTMEREKELEKKEMKMRSIPSTIFFTKDGPREPQLSFLSTGSSGRSLFSV